jgi:hypothetical protein
MEAVTVAVRSTGDGIAAGDEDAEGEGVAAREGDALEAGDTAGLACTGDGESPDAEHAASTRPRRATKVTGATARAEVNEKPVAKATGRVTWPT